MKFRIIIGILAVCLWGSCVANESSVFVREMKAPAAPPDCTSSTSDAFTPLGLFDISFRSSYASYFLLENRLMAREDYSKPTAETNGVIIEGAEVSVRAMNGSPITQREYYEFEGYIPPESEGIIFASVIPATATNTLSQQLGCPQKDSLPVGTNVFYTMVYADVKFLGHTNGGTDVETPSFTVGIEICCGCLINWTNCMVTCDMYCEDPDGSGMCIDGVANGGGLYDCRNIYHNPNASWTVTETDPITGAQVTNTYTCETCS